jgi:predicted nucleic acid-binding protein
MKIFVDTSAFYALADEDDRYHHQAEEFYSSVITRDQLVTTDYILVECWFLIGSRLGRRAAMAC